MQKMEDEHSGDSANGVDSMKAIHQLHYVGQVNIGSVEITGDDDDSQNEVDSMKMMNDDSGGRR
jgi:hypothetical protein